VRETQTVPIVLVGNKCDLLDKRVVSYDTGFSVAQKCNAAFLECSAKAGINVNEIFETIARLVIPTIPPQKNEEQNTI